MPNRYERRSRPVSVAPVIALAILMAGIAYAQQNLPVPPAPATPATAPPAAPGAQPAPAGEPSTAAGTNSPAKPAAATGSPQRFEPTEKVRPDFDVAFPVDI